MDLQEIVALLLQYKYVIMFGLMIIEGPIVSFISAFLAVQGHFNFFLVYLLSVSGDIIGDLIWFTVGLLSQNKIIQKIIQKATNKIKDKKIIEKIRNKIEKNPFITLFIIKITPPISIPGLILFGYSKIKFWKYLIYTTIISIILESIFLNLGYFSGISINIFKSRFNDISLTISAIFVGLLMLGLGFLIIKKLRKKFKLSSKDNFKS